MSRANDGELVSGINVTPLVDVTLVLLVVMMVAAPLIASGRVSMKLPKATTAEASSGERALVIDLFADGRKKVSGDVDAATRAVIRADGAVRHERVIAALDDLRRAGIKRVAFAVTPSAR